MCKVVFEDVMEVEVVVVICWLIKGCWYLMGDDE